MKNQTTPIITLNNQALITNHSLTDNCNVEVHLHDSNEIYIALSPNIRYYIEGKYYDLSPGDIIITNTQEVHRPTTTDNTPYHRLFTLFNPSAFLPYIEDYSIFACFNNRKVGHNNWLSGEHPLSNQIKTLMFKIITQKEQKHPRSNIYQKVLAMEMFLLLDELYSAQYKGFITDLRTAKSTVESDLRIEAILSDINQNFNAEFDLTLLAEKHFMDRYYLCHLFKSKTGFTVFEYLQTRRILKAKELISQGDKSLTEISHLVGYEDYTNFYKTFKKLVQISPTEYKKKLFT